MIEFGLLILLICVVLVGVVVALPIFVSFNHEIESSPNHFYNIFMEESGFRGFRVISAILVFMPLGAYALPKPDAKYALFFGLVWLYALYSHTRLFVGVNLFTPKIVSLLVFVILVHILFPIAERQGYIGGSSLIFILSAVSLLWGVVVCYQRSKFIKHNKLSKRDAEKLGAPS